jgi:rsbT co-antagonist protein RsbR
MSADTLALAPRLTEVNPEEGDSHGGQALPTHDEKALLRDMELSAAEVAQRKAFLEFHEDDVDRLMTVNELATEYADPVIEDFYTHLLTFEETADFFRDPKVLEYVKRMQKEYFLRLTAGEYDEAYIENRLSIGAVHEQIGLPVKAYLGMYNFYLRTVANRLAEAFPGEPERVSQVFHSLMKLVFLDIGLAIDTYIFQRERTIGQQQEAIRELSTPALQVRDRLLILPIIGVLDAGRARQLTEGLLTSIRATRAKVVILDITGVPTVDSTVANHLIQTVEASRLMGATVIVSGLSAEVAQTLVTLGLDLTKLNVVGDLQGGIEQAERMLGYAVVPLDDGAGSSRGARDASSDSQAR